MRNKLCLSVGGDKKRNQTEIQSFNWENCGRINIYFKRFVGEKI